MDQQRERLSDSTSPSRVVGLVSNSWKTQLDLGQSLERLIDDAAQSGMRAIELRQGNLGEFASSVAVAGSSLADATRLIEFAQRFPAVSLNLAVSLPYIEGRNRDNDRRFTAAFAAAMALAPNGPHLRLVDTETRVRRLDATAIAAAGSWIADMTRLLIRVGGRLSIEHAYQEWSVFRSVVRHARKLLRSRALRLRVCFDPCNLLLTESESAIPEIVAGIKPDDVSMIHLKQRRDGQIQSDVSDGDLDWRELLQILERNGHRGPWLFELAPHVEIREKLHRSVEYVFGEAK